MTYSPWAPMDSNHRLPLGARFTASSLRPLEQTPVFFRVLPVRLGVRPGGCQAWARLRFCHLRRERTDLDAVAVAETQI